ncbi:MAG TPA: hypothetical protein VF630_07240 [Hymenobacter sp.]
MQHTDLTLSTDTVEMFCSPDSEETEELLVFEFAVPLFAKVPPPRQRVEITKLLVQQSSVTSTVPGKVLMPLRANNTSVSAGWCITATLTAPSASRPSSRY